MDFVPTVYYARNPSLLRTRGSYEPLRDEDNAINTVWPVRPNPGTNRAYQAGIDRADGTLARFTAVCAPLVYRGDRLPAELYGNAFVAEPAANLVSRIILTDDGTTLRARKAYDNAEFLASTDERFRPVYLSNAPDGTLYIVDMYRGIIQDRAYTTIYLRDHIVRRKLDRPIGLGRIYRVVHETTRRDTSTTLATATPAQLVDVLAHPNGWWRDTAQRLLVERGARPVVGALTRLAESAKDPRARLHALWTLDGIDAIERATVMKALDDTSRDVRASAIRIAERWLGDPADPIQAAVLKRLDDGDWEVRHQLAASIGTLPVAARGNGRGRLPRTARRRPDRARRDPQRAARQRSRGPRQDDAGRSGRADAAARDRHHDARGDDRAGVAGGRRSEHLHVDRRREPRGLAAVGVAARHGGRVAWRRHARISNRTPGRAAGGHGVAVSDLSGRTGGSGRRICVPAPTAAMPQASAAAAGADGRCASAASRRSCPRWRREVAISERARPPCSRAWSGRASRVDRPPSSR